MTDEPDANDPDLMTSREVARLLRTSPAGLSQMRIRGGGPPFYRRNTFLRYRRSEVLAWLEEFRVDPKSRQRQRQRQGEGEGEDGS